MKMQQEGRYAGPAQPATPPLPPVMRAPITFGDVVTSSISPISRISLTEETGANVQPLPRRDNNRGQNDDIWTAFAPPISEIRLVVEEPVHAEELPPVQPQQHNRWQNDHIWGGFASPMYSDWGEGDDGFQC
jgi:hypothetical protein